MIRRTRRPLALLVALCTLAAACATPAAAPSKPAASAPASAAAPAPGGAPAAASPPTKVILAQTATSPSGWPMYVAQERGFYTEEGVDIERLDLPSSVTQTQALISGDIHINSYTVDSVARAVQGGAPIKMIASAQEVPNLQLIVGKGVESFADLRGKTLGAGSPGGYFNVLLIGMLQTKGLEPNEYDVVSVRDVRARIPALQSGQLAGTLMSSPDDQIALKEGFKSLGAIHETFPSLMYNGYAVADSWAKANEAALVRFLRGTLRGLTWLREPANKEESKQILFRAIEMPPDVLEIMYQQMVVEKMLGTDLRPNISGSQKVLDMGMQQGSLPPVPPPETWIDLSYLEQASRPAR